eukprot:CAMPEP_0206370074 /NCGR_PEP_ID=MMETSP0294-20121207/5687_1 /ASSEMBLY_ACC=CAM_ASM_000327 /TAXON_ID=39354 /ORGANISM="Heterosigma akashiwo, Strain CCMP2393" /LENGTH=43 /DNA_ID= /DNA_START= /DNA_END= /DNA_ORIENTATION=
MAPEAEQEGYCLLPLPLPALPPPPPPPPPPFLGSLAPPGQTPP